MSHYKPYPEYKDSSVEWLGKVPYEWGFIRLKFLFNLQKRPIDVDEIVTCFRDGQVTLRRNRRTEGFTNAFKEHGYQGVAKGDLVIHAMDAFAGAVGVSDSDGKMSPVCSVVTPGKKMPNANFYSYMLRTMAISGFIESLSKGIRERSSDFRWSEAKEVVVPVPQRDEQNHIVSYLDSETYRIDTLITKKRRFIDLLKERHQALITQAVTKGLDPDVQMKESGVAAIGEIPSHWKIKPLRSEMSLKKKIVGGHWDKYSLLSLTRRGIIFRDVSDNFGKFPESFETYQEVEKNDLVMCLFDIDETPRTVGVSKIDGMITGAYSVFSIENEVYREYLYQTFMHLDNEKGMKPYYSGLRKTIRPSRLLGIHFPFPPEEEAKAICDHINKGTDRINRLITRTQRSIDLLKERRAALITAAVTGKIDLRDENGKEAA
ncbi:restriction endonuclease subunit S [uncultured Halomonas sp.]|uniref:restriction endonuclease subunit S n=1 Tax=uncultured Halomonas sp. TaxID=173971 RepID=UPI00261101D4|nr:restriction endonuclease subunit S [uncultured Halomonas sp.]